MCMYVYIVNTTYLSYVQIYEETPRELLEMPSYLPETRARALPKMARVTIQEDSESVEVTPKCLLLESKSRDREEAAEATFGEAVSSILHLSKETYSHIEKRPTHTLGEAGSSIRVASESAAKATALSQATALMQHLHFENSALQEENKGLVCVCVCVCVLLFCLSVCLSVCLSLSLSLSLS